MLSYGPSMKSRIELGVGADVLLPSLGRLGKGAMALAQETRTGLDPKARIGLKEKNPTIMENELDPKKENQVPKRKIPKHTLFTWWNANLDLEGYFARAALAALILRMHANLH